VLGLRHLDVSNLRGRDDQDRRKARKQQEEEARDAESNAELTERRKEAQPEAAEPNSEEADDSENESRSERAEERRCDSETLNQPRPQRPRRTQRMRQRPDSKEAEKGRCRPGGSMLCKERREEHVRGRPKDHTSYMHTEFCGTAKTRKSVCGLENAEAPKATKFRVSTGRHRSGGSYRIPCVGGKTPKPRKHEISCDGGKSPKTRKYGIPCDTKFRVVVKR
jgi:hypothetical protein